MDNKITQEKLDKYFDLTSRALVEVKEHIAEDKDIQGDEIIQMVSNYLSDARHFEKKEDFVNAFAALNYAHGWIDCGVRLKVFEVTDRDLFTVCDVEED
jgi:hypothetical protein